MTNFPLYPNQGHMIVAGWDNAANLKNITAYFGTAGLRFLPIDDRNGYSDGVERNMGTGGLLMAGLPILKPVSPWISDDQLEYIRATLLSGNRTGPVTFAGHIPSFSVGVNDVVTVNAQMNMRLNQLQSLQRERNGYRGFVWELVIVEVL